MTAVSVLIPTYTRHDGLRRSIDSLRQSVREPVEVVVAAEMYPVEGADSLGVVYSFCPTWRGSVAGWNRAASLATGNLLVLGADDILWHDGWLDAALEAMQKAGTCYVGLNDLEYDGAHNPTHWAITRQGVIDYCGGCVMPPPYKTTWADNEIAARIKRAGHYAWAERAIAEHIHFSNDKAPQDRCYRTMSRHYFEDQSTFEKRRDRGFPDDFEPVVRP